MTEHQIQNHLYKWREKAGVKLIVPNTQVFEGISDLICISKTDLAFDYEIKLTRSDFRADFKKPKHEFLKDVRTFPRYAKFCANYFAFVVPDNLIEVADVPKYAGLIYFKLAGKAALFTEVRKPPRLHKNKVTQKQLDFLARGLMLRYWKARTK